MTFITVDDTDQDFSIQINIPEQKLLWAMLMRAIHDLFSYETNDFKTAHYWVFTGNRDTSAAIPFWYCCEQLDLDPMSLRSAIKRLLKTTANMDMRAFRAQIRNGRT